MNCDISRFRWGVDKTLDLLGYWGCRLVVDYRRFGKIYLPHACLLKMGPIFNVETLIIHYQPTPPNISEEGRPRAYR
jgi:hypothetical protein